MTARLTEDQATAIMPAAHAEPLEPYGSVGSPWRCRCLVCHQEISPRLANVKSGQGACVYCAGQRVNGTHAAEVMSAQGMEPAAPFPGSKKPWLCRCKICGRQSTPFYTTYEQGRGGCVWCAGNRVDPQEAAELMRSKGLTTLDPFVASHARWRCRCQSCGKEVTPCYSSVRAGQGGCVWCAGQAVDPDKAVADMRAAFLDPLEPFTATNLPWSCRCIRCHRVVSPRLDNVRQGRGGCVWCAGQRVDPEAVVAEMRLRNLEPLLPYPGARRRWQCRCTLCDHVVYPTWMTIQQGQGGCVWCAKQKVDPVDAAALMRRHDLEPLEPYTNSSNKWLCRCTKCHAEVRIRYNTVSAQRSGCRNCADMGFQWEAPGVVYLLQHSAYYVMKIGKTTTVAKTDRLALRLEDGWELVCPPWFVPTGSDAHDIEQQVLSYWRVGLGAPVALSKGDVPGGGYTETVSMLWADPEDTVALVQAGVGGLANRLTPAADDKDT